MGADARVKQAQVPQGKGGAAAAAAPRVQQHQAPRADSPSLQDDAEANPASSADKKKKRKKKKKAAAAAAVVSSDAEDDEGEQQEVAEAPVEEPEPEADEVEEEDVVVVALARSRKSNAKVAAPESPAAPAGAWQPPVYTKSKFPSRYKEGSYPRSVPGRSVHPRVPFWTALSTYFAYGLLIVVGHVRDFLNRWGIYRTTKSSPQHRNTVSDMAPLVSDFDDFFTRRLYHRIEHAWNRPIASCPAPVTTLLVRERQGYGTPYERTGEHKHVLNLGSYNYLGFGDPASPTKPDVFAALEHFSVSTSSPRVALGTTALHAELERVTARFVGKEAAMIFGMGFGTNSTGIPALVGKGGLIISDANNHSSIACGARTSGAVIRVFKHNDVRSLEAVLRHAIIGGQPKSHRPWTKILILVEGIYSMEGEICPLQEIVALKKKYGAYLFVDEAHSIGAIGSNGRGICEYSGVPPSDVDVLMGTFTKSFGAVGGYIAADRDVIEFLRVNSAGSVYSSSISPPAVQQVLSAFKIMLHEDGTTIGRDKLDTLRENSNYFRQKLQEMGAHTLGDWDSPIVLLMLYHPAKITAFSEECLRRGLAVVVVGFPATPLLLARVRFCVSAGHTREQLDYALWQLEDVTDMLGCKYAKNQLTC